MTAVVLGTNGDFDSGIGDWAAWVDPYAASSIATHDAGFARTGGSLLLTRTAGAAPTGAMVASTPTPLGSGPPDGDYLAVPAAVGGAASFSVWYYTTAPSITVVTAEVTFSSGGDMFVVTEPVTGAWTELVVTGTVDAGPTGVLLLVGAGGGEDPPAAGAEIWWDDFTLEYESVPAASGWVVG